MPKAQVKVSGTWQTLTKIQVKVSGVWQTVTKGFVNVSGTWQNFTTADPITIPSNWTPSANTVPTTLTSGTKTLTVPSGNPGNIRIDMTDGGTGGTWQYSKNGGTFTTFSTGQTLSVANGDTLAFKDLNMGSNNTDIFTVVDTAASATVGSWSAIGI